jgi:sugar phosphate isomerase/epimerase
MMKYIGHTMGVPELTLEEAMKLFSRLGFDGIEIRCAAEGHLDTDSAEPGTINEIKRWSRTYELPVTCLTSYFKDFVTEKRSRELESLKKVIAIAEKLDTPFVRLYGGIDPPPDGWSAWESWDKTVSGIKELSQFCEEKKVLLCIETHNGSLTYTAEDAVKMIREINRPNVGILLDFAWIHFRGKESPEEAVKLCGPYIFHCHYKDWKIGPEGSREACLMGEGDIPWERFFRALKASGYDGSLSDEYERYWHPADLPPAESGMKKNLSFVKNHLGSSISD